MFLFVLLVFAITVQSINSSSVPICKGIKVDYFIDSRDVNKNVANFSFNINVATDENNATYPNIVTFSDYTEWSINSTFQLNNTINLHIFPGDYGWVYYKYNSTANMPYIFNIANYYTAMSIEIGMNNDRCDSEMDMFFNDGTILEPFNGAILNEQNPCIRNCIWGYGCNNIDIIQCSACCNDFQYIEIPDSNDEICEVFETNAKYSLMMSNSFTNYFVYGLSYPTKYGLNSYVNANRYGITLNNNMYCFPNTTCSLSIPFNDFQLEITLEYDLNFKLGEIIRRNGMYFKHNNIPYTSADPCWTYNGSIPYRESNETYESSFCCVKFQPNITKPTTPSITISTSTTNAPTFTQVPVCKGVKVMYFWNNTYHPFENFLTVSFNLNVATDKNNATYPNIVTFSNYSEWHINSSYESNGTITFYASAYPLSFIQSWKVDLLNNTSTFHFADFFLKFSLYFPQNFNPYPYDQLNGNAGYFNDGTILNPYTTFSNFFYNDNNSCINPKNDQNFFVTQSSLLCCTSYDYVTIPISYNEICLEFETKATFYDPYYHNTSFYAHSFVTPYGLNTHVITNITLSSIYFSTQSIRGNDADCYPLDNQSTICSQPFPLGDFEYVFYVYYYDSVLKTIKVGELIQRNGMYFKNTNVPYTLADPCWTYNGSIPVGYGDDGSYESSFCCIKFGPSDYFSTGIPSLPPTKTSVTLPLSSTLPTTVTSPMPSSQSIPTTFTSPLPTFQPPSERIGTPCSTDISRAWLDIVFVIDTSSTMGKYNIKGLTGALVTIIQTFNIAQTGDHTTRIGIITYATSVTIRYQLNDVTNFDDVEQAFFKLASYVNSDDNGVNANDALQQAFDSYESQRSQRIPLIVLIAAGYDGNGFQNAYQTAKTIKANGISIITINFGISDSTLKTELESIASPGYSYMSDQSDLYSILPYAFTQINCFCPKNTYQLRNYNALWKNYTAYADCYFGFPESTNPSIANNIGCDPGVLAAVTSPAQFNFITDNIIPYPLKRSKKFTIGLHKSTDDSSWKWWNYDKSEYPYDYSYPNMSQTPDPSDNYGYMWNYQGFNWKLQTGNNVPLPYVCQMKACDASYICDQSPLKKLP